MNVAYGNDAPVVVRLWDGNNEFVVFNESLCDVRMPVGKWVR